MRFIHIADVHLGARPDKGLSWEDERAQEIWDSFDRVLETAAEKKVDFLLIAGDLFHRQPLKRELKEVNYRFEKLYPARIVMIAGNHDYIGENSYYRDFKWADNVYFFKSQKLSCLYFEDKQAYIYGLSYEHYEITEPLYDRVRPVSKPGCHILLAHGGDEKHIPIGQGLFSAGFDYIALGHIHKPEILRADSAAYAGALEPIDRNDTGSHGYVEGVFEDGELHIQFVPSAKREYIHLPVRMDSRMPWAMAADIVKDEIERRGSENIYKLILGGFLAPDVTPDYRLLERLGRIAEIEDNTVPDYDFDLLYAQNKDNIIGKYIERIRSLEVQEDIKEKALYCGIQALLKLE